MESEDEEKDLKVAPNDNDGEDDNDNDDEDDNNNDAGEEDDDDDDDKEDNNDDYEKDVCDFDLNDIKGISKNEVLHLRPTR